MKKPNSEVPSWLFFGLMFSGDGLKWTEEKEQTALKIVASLKKHAEAQYWPKEVLDTVLRINKHDDARGYMQDVPEV